jgi:hypothetical protein
MPPLWAIDDMPDAIGTARVDVPLACGVISAADDVAGSWVRAMEVS